ncbi:MAG: helix-turn-helix domain-containing protein [Clostridia bacterium]|nr:helix-turn-helix domain-containing protein [Clostridia bacterium]
MSVGEKIQFYRKELGLSQEELGKKLLVSRQTISLWENDQTVPTIDNLIRLKEIFGVSVDDILGVDEKTQPVEQPKEEYTFSFEKEEVVKISKAERNKLIRKLILIIVFFVLLIVVSCNSVDFAVIGWFLVGFLICFVTFNLKMISVSQKNWKGITERLSSSTYKYKVYDNYFTVEIKRNGEKVRDFKFYFNDIENMSLTDNHIVMTVGGQGFLLNKNLLKENSFFYNRLNHFNQKKVIKIAPNKLRITANLLLIASLVSPFFALYVQSAFQESSNLMSFDYMWVFFLFTPIPVASIVFGFILKSKGYVYLKNVIIGIILTIMLCVYGCFGFIFEDVISNDEAVITYVEEMVNIDIPEHKNITTQDWTGGTQEGVSGSYLYTTSDIEFDEENALAFESQIKNDPKWLSEVPNKLIGLSTPIANLKTCDYAMIYNSYTDEFNTLPKEAGEYHCITLIYTAERKLLQIVEYDIEYN